ncbi:MAG TPA: phytanoyl-CoA dioxygenase family protein [Acidimicrobiales bacterium]|nr:phytanoyl-CoA dioxygenase family protein [Acidimicrobiales bacterium]
MVPEVLTAAQRSSWEEHGYFRIDGFAEAELCRAMLDDVIDIARRFAAGEKVSPAYITPENNLRDAGRAGRPEELVSKIFRLHRRGPFHDFAVSAPVVDLLADLFSSAEVDCFLSQFIFKNPGAWGQPWHQDSYYFPFDPDGGRPIAGVWLAVTEATLENGCLHVLPGSQREPVHEHVPDRRPNANAGYVEIVDHDTAAAQPVLMKPGDLLVFDSHLMHRSTDNVSDGIRAAMVFHYCRAGVTDRHPSPLNDFMPARRQQGALV